MRNSKQQIDNFNKTKKNIIEIINANLNLSQTEIATLLNNSNIRTIRGMKWTNGSVSDFMIIHMGINSKQANFPSVEYKKAIDKIIIDNKDRKLEFIAGVLNKHNLKTVKHKKWTIASVCKYKKQKLNLKLNDSNSILEPDFGKLRFNENILNQLDKMELKVTLEPELEKEVLPNYEIKDLVFEKEGKFFTDSLMISSIFEKEHSKVLDSIKKILETGEIDDADFSVISYQDKIKRTQYKYLISKNGFALLGMGFTGDKALKFKIAYIKQFNKMEEALKNIQRELSTLELMEMTSKTFREQETKVLFEIKKESESIKHETNQVLQKQKIEFDKQFKALDERISNIPTASQPTEQLSFIQGNTKFINIDEKMQSKAHKEDDLFKATKDLIYKYSVKSKKDEWDIYPLLYKTFKHSTGIYLEKEKNIYNKQFLVAERISTIKYAQLKGHIPELHQIMTNLYNNLILACEKG